MKAQDIRAALAKRYKAPEASIVFEVAQSTGHAAHRHLDAVAMELWPSRGFGLHGIEIKVSRSDWRAELRNPEKSEQVARFCDFFWIAAPAGIVLVDDLPSAWGLMEVGPGGAISIAKRAEITPAVEVNKGFLAAMMRAATRPMASNEVEIILAERRAQLNAEMAERVEEAVRARVGAMPAYAQRWKDLLAQLGENPSWAPSDAIIAAVKAVHRGGLAKSYGGIRSIIEACEQTAGHLRAVADEMNIETPKRKPSRKAA